MEKPPPAGGRRLDWELVSVERATDSADGGGPPQTPAETAALFRNGIAGDADFRTVAAMAARLFDAPLALVTLGEPHRRIQAAGGPGAPQALAALPAFDRLVAMLGNAPLVLADTGADERFGGLPGEGGAVAPRFFAGAPILAGDRKVGSLCVFGAAPPPQERIADLARLARLAGSLTRLKEESHAKADFERALSHAHTRHALALRAANIATWSWDLGSDRISCDPTLRRMLSLPEDEPLSGGSLIAAVIPADREAMQASIYASIHRDEEYAGEFRTLLGNRWVLGLGRVYDRAEDGTARRMFGVYLDITQRKRSEQKTRLLLRELNHRVKNTLAILQSVAQQTLRRSRDPDDFAEAFSGRLQALAAAHTLLSDEEWEDIDIAELLRSQLMPYAPSFGDSVFIDSPRIPLRPDEALALSLVIHELASNAARFGALSRRSGRLDIVCSLTADDAPVLTLDWVESGGPSVTSPVRHGFGSAIIRRSLDKIVGSRVDLAFEPRGMRARLIIPLQP